MSRVEWVKGAHATMFEMRRDVRELAKLMRRTPTFAPLADEMEQAIEGAMIEFIDGPCPVTVDHIRNLWLSFAPRVAEFADSPVR